MTLCYQCYNCEKDFEEPIIINGEKICPYCYSGDNNANKEDDENENII